MKYQIIIIVLILVVIWLTYQWKNDKSNNASLERQINNLRVVIVGLMEKQAGLEVSVEKMIETNFNVIKTFEEFNRILFQSYEKIKEESELSEEETKSDDPRVNFARKFLEKDKEILDLDLLLEEKFPSESLLEKLKEIRQEEIKMLGIYKRKLREADEQAEDWRLEMRHRDVARKESNIQEIDNKISTVKKGLQILEENKEKKRDEIILEGEGNKEQPKSESSLDAKQPYNEVLENFFQGLSKKHKENK